MANYRKGIVSITLTNILRLALNFVAAFVLPALLSVEQYGYVKVYQLYIAYVGVLHLGFADGMYLSYGGKQFDELDKSVLDNQRKTLQVFQFIIMLAIAAFGIVLHNYIIIILAISVYPLNCINFYSLLYQAVGEYTRYAKTVNYTCILTFIANVGLLLAGVRNYQWFILSYAIVDYICLLLLERDYYNLRGKSHGKFESSILKSNVSMGILLMLGNFASIIFTGIDKYFINWFFPIVSFSYYSFAVSLTTFVNLFTDPIGLILYNYLSNNQGIEMIKRLKRVIMLLAYFLIIMAFPGRYLMNFVLDKYIPANNVIFILFGCHPLLLVVSCVYVNMYKVEKKQKRYFTLLLYSLGVAIVLDAIVSFTIKSIDLIAVATLISIVFWYLLCEHDYPSLHRNWKEIIFHVGCMSSFILSGIYLNPILGLVIYGTVFTLLAVLFYRKDIKYVINLVLKR